MEKKKFKIKKESITRLIAGILLFTLMYGCTPKPIDLELEAHVSRLVISSQIIPKTRMFVSLTKSFSALSNSTVNDTVSSDFLNSILVSNAFVTVSYLNKIDTLSMVAPGIYASDSVLQFDYGRYMLYAMDPSSGLVVTSSSTLLPIVKFDSIVPRVDKTMKDTAISVNYSFTDIPGIDNWYVIYYYSKRNTASSNSLDISSFFNRGSNKLEEIELLSDKTFDNGKYHYKKTLNNIHPNDTIAVALSNISKGYFEFLHTYKKAGNIVNQLTGEPINYPTNINGGYGYFNTHYPDAHIFSLEKY
jgi:hypothetical protein